MSSRSRPTVRVARSDAGAAEVGRAASSMTPTIRVSDAPADCTWSKSPTSAPIGLNSRWKTSAAVVTAPALDSPAHTSQNPVRRSRDRTTASARLLRLKARVRKRNTPIERSRASAEAESMRVSSTCSARWARSVRAPVSPPSSRPERRPIAARSRAYRGADRGRYQRSVSQYIGSAVSPTSPNRQSTTARPTADTTTTSSDSTTSGSTWAAPSLTLRESSATRETRSPVPVRSTRGASSDSAAVTTSVRRSPTAGIVTRASAHAPAHVPTAMTMPAAATAAAEVHTTSAPLPAGSASTRRPIAHGPTRPAAAFARPAMTRRTIQPARPRRCGARCAKARRRVAMGRVAAAEAAGCPLIGSPPPGRPRRRDHPRPRAPRGCRRRSCRRRGRGRPGPRPRGRRARR